MAIFNARLTNIDIAETKRYAGFSHQTNFPENLVDEACTSAHILAKPTSSWRIYPYDNQQQVIQADQPLFLEGKGITAHLASATAVAILALTIGENLEQAVTELFAAGNYAHGLLLDAAGTTAVESAADQLSEYIKQQVILQGFTTLSRFSPGYSDWSITVQPKILALAQGSIIGMKVSQSYMLIPRKSITAVIGLIPAKNNIQQPRCVKNPCNHCKQVNCLARKEQSQS